MPVINTDLYIYKRNRIVPYRTSVSLCDHLVKYIIVQEEQRQVCKLVGYIIVPGGQVVPDLGQICTSCIFILK